MKKIVMIPCLGLLLAASPLQKKDMTTLLINKKWQPAFAEYEGEVEELDEEEMENSYCLFLKNGTFEVNDDGDIMIGYWELNQLDSTLTLSDTVEYDTLVAKLLNITATELRVYDSMEEEIFGFRVGEKN